MTLTPLQIEDFNPDSGESDSNHSIQSNASRLESLEAAERENQKKPHEKKKSQSKDKKRAQETKGCSNPFH